MSGWFAWAPRKNVATRRADAEHHVAESRKRGHELTPVVLAGRKIAQTFWGKGWCDNLERYRDFAYRLERGRSYLRSGSVIDLRITAGKVSAKVLGSSLYTISIEIDAVAQPAWRAIQRDCAGGIGSRIDLLAGTLSEAVMTRLCVDRAGLFPHPAAIRFDCSCPDHANVCKHVAAAMYGIGARLDQSPELLFTLRQVSLDELVAAAVTALPAAPSPGRVLASDGLAALFGIELADAAATPAAPRARRRGRASSERPASAPPVVSSSPGRRNRPGRATATSATVDPPRTRRAAKPPPPPAVAALPTAGAREPPRAAKRPARRSARTSAADARTATPASAPARSASAAQRSRDRRGSAGPVRSSGARRDGRRATGRTR